MPGDQFPVLTFPSASGDFSQLDETSPLADRRFVESKTGAAVKLIVAACTTVVTSAADSGSGTLRQAILCANSTPGTDSISFNIPGSGLHTIAPTSNLPPITEAVTINGYTQPGASENTLAVGDDAVLKIEIDASSPALNYVVGFSNSNGSTVRGLVLNHLSASGFVFGVFGSGQPSNNNTVAGNFLGTDVTGTTFLGGTTFAATIQDNSTGNTIGGTSAKRPQCDRGTYHQPGH